MPHHVSSNVISFPSIGKAITLDDQGIYYALNTRTGSIHSVFQLVYQDEWYLYQLECVGDEDEMSWSLLSGNIDYALNSMTTEQIRAHFIKPEYLEPRGAWQVIKNSKFGIGKFTPSQAGEPILYAILVFKDGEMLSPILIHKAESEAEAQTSQTAESFTRLKLANLHIAELS
jgi:hypothetical protein